ncbi:MAG: hypothetical protein Q9193_002394 [Seirophora villosa]
MFFCVEEFNAVGDQGVRKAANSTLDLVHSILLRAFDDFVALQESFWYLDNLHNAPAMVRNTPEQLLETLDSTLVLPAPPTCRSGYNVGATILNAWENFAYPIPPTKQVLRGRIFTLRPIRPGALFFMIAGGIATTRRQIPELGDACLRARDNLYAYMVPGCHFCMWSKTAKRSGAPVMTYRMMQEVFLALEEVLQKDERKFEATFVLTDEDCVSWDDGEVFSVDVCTSNSSRPFIFASSVEIEESEEGEVIFP